MAITPYTSQRLIENYMQSVQQPKPLPLKRSYASFLGESVDQCSSSPPPKRHRPEAVDNSVTQWVKSESYRERHCRSDRLFGHSDGDLISRRLTKSAPNIEYAQDVDGFVLPSTPVSAYALSVAP
jgi:hypothetical protein